MFTDMEGSTLLWERHPHVVVLDVLAAHKAILQGAAAKWEGQELGSEGDAFSFLFDTGSAAVQCAIEVQEALGAHPWPKAVGDVKVRIGIHTGELLFLEEGKHREIQGMPATLTKRITDAGHGGQILLSAATHELVKAHFPRRSFRDLGEHRLKNLSHPERIFQFSVSDTDAFPPLKTMDTLPNNLPAPMTSFIGREAEVAEIVRYLTAGNPRLLTLTGAGGIGKTRLALQSAAELLAHYRHGVWFISLAALVSPDFMLTEIATALAIPLKTEQAESDDVMKQVVAYLAEKELLLVLDNFEHLMEAVMHVNTLLRGCPRVQCLVTSRHVLQISGEQTFRVPPLSVPSADDTCEVLQESESVQLFLARAKAVSPQFKLTGENAAAVGAICRALDGLSLAIELAAARVRGMTPQDILSRLSTQLAFLTTPNRDVPARHQTLIAVMSWSFELLSAEEQRLLGQLSHFSGGFSLEAAEAICSPSVGGVCNPASASSSVGKPEQFLPRSESRAASTLALIFSLHDKSLLITTGARYRLSVPLQLYMREKRQASDAFREAHAAYYLTLARALDKKLRGAAQTDALSEMAQELDNFRAALAFLAAGAAWHPFSQLAVALTQFFYVRGLWGEGVAWLQQAETALRPPEGAVGARCQRVIPANGEEPDDTLAHVLVSLAKFYNTQQQCETARRLCEEALQLFRTAGHRHGVATGLNLLGIIARYQGAPEAADAHFTESLQLAKALGDKWLIAYALDNLGLTAYTHRRFEVAKRLYTESLQLARELGDKRGIAYSLNNLGKTANQQGSHEEAKRYHTESLDIRGQLADKRGIAISLNHLGLIAYRQMAYAEAIGYHTESLAIQRELGDKQGVSYSLSHLGLIAYQQGDDAAAARHYTESLQFAREVAQATATSNMPYLLDSLGKIALRQGNLDDARRCYTESLQLRKEGGYSRDIADSLYQFGRLYRAEGHFERSLLLFFTAARVYAETDAAHTLNARAVQNAMTQLHEHLDDETVERCTSAAETQPLEEIIALCEKMG